LTAARVTLTGYCHSVYSRAARVDPFVDPAGAITRADCHLAPMIAAFVQAPEGRDMLARFPTLSAWWAGIVCRPSLRDTETPLPNSGHGG
jgi:glutathione S-transferase